jgi:hypothetical protein
MVMKQDAVVAYFKRSFQHLAGGKGRTLSVGDVTEIETPSSHEHEFWLKSNNNGHFMCWSSPVSARGNYCPGSTCQPRDHTGSPHYDVIIKQDIRQVTHAYMGHSSSSTGAYSPGWTFGLPFRSFLITHIQTHGRTPLDEWSARRRDLYLHRTTQHRNTRHKRPCPQRDSNPRPQQPSGRRDLHT